MRQVSNRGDKCKFSFLFQLQVPNVFADKNNLESRKTIPKKNDPEAELRRLGRRQKLLIQKPPEFASSWTVK